MGNFLDKAGLARVWGKVKSLVSTAKSEAKSEAVSSVYATVPLVFDGVTDEDITVLDSTTVNMTSLLWSSKKGRFVAKDEAGKYYSNWGTTERYRGTMAEYNSARLFVMSAKLPGSVIAGDYGVFARVVKEISLGGTMSYSVVLEKVGEAGSEYTLPVAAPSRLGGVKSGGDITVGADGTVTVNDDSHNHTVENVDGLQTALDAKAPLASPTLTGTPKAPTAAAGNNTTQIATTAFVVAEINNKIAAADAMIYKGTLGTGGTVTALPATHKTGWAYKVITAGTYAGQKCEAGDMVICLTDGTAAKDADWTVVQTNIDGAVTGPASAVSGRVAAFDGTTGKLIKDSGFTIGKSVPSDAVFTDTVYTHPAGSAANKAAGLYNISTDAQSHVKSMTAVTKEDITALGIPSTDTKYTALTEAEIDEATR